MKQKKKIIAFLCVIQLMAMLAAGCGRNMGTNNQTNDTGVPEATSQTGTQTNGTDQTGKSDGNVNNGNRNDLGATGNAVNDAAEGAGNAIKDVGQGVGNAVDDVADGIGDAVNNLGGGSFDSYEDAREYLLGKLNGDNKAAHYELRNEKKDLVSYNGNDADAQGYEFSVYETDGNEKIGRYYVDKETGKIYRYMGKNSIEAY